MTSQAAPSLSRVRRPLVRGLILPALLFVAALILLLVVADDAAATHYRYGTLSWEPTGNPNEVRFTGAQAWRASAFPNPNVGNIITGEASIATGDGGFVQPYLKVVSRNTVNDWFFAEFVDQNGAPGLVYTYSAPNNNGQPWLASWSSCCRISPTSSGNYHVNNPDQSEALYTFVDLATGNASPKTNLPPINSCPINAVCTIPIPFIDPDGDTLSFRLATVSEAGDSFYVPPGAPHATNQATIHPTSGVITWDTNGATYNANYHTLYSMQVMLEDGLTKTPLDFFIELIPPGVVIPEWTPASNCGGSLSTNVNGPVQFTVTAFSTDPARILTMDHLGLPPGATFPLPAPANPVSGTFTWTPTESDAGSHIVIFTAVDDLGYAAPSCAVTLHVIPHPPPEFYDTPCGFANTLLLTEDHPLTFPAYADTINLSRTVTLSLVSGPAGLTFTPGAPGNPTSGTAHWPAALAGQHTVVLRATDSGGIFSLCTVHLDVTPIPPPTCAVPALFIGLENVPLDYGASAESTSPYRTVTLTLTAAPAGVALDTGPAANPVTGTIAWPLPQFGLYTVTLTATDSKGLVGTCTTTLDIRRPDAESHTLGLWIGQTVPVSAEYETDGADATGGTSTGGVRHVLDLPTLQLHAEAIEETATSLLHSPNATATGYSETGYVSLLNGLVQVWGLVNEAQLTWDARDSSYDFTDTRQIARLLIDGNEVPIDDSAGTITLGLPTGGTLTLFERTTTADSDGVVVRSNLIHLHNAPAYSGTELILGSLLLQAGNVLDPITQERLLLHQDDAHCGCDAPGGTTGAVPIGPGIHHGSVPGTDSDDMYALDLAHGEKVILLLDGAERITVAGGRSQLGQPPLPPSLPPTLPGLVPPAIGNSIANDYRVTLYDPTGAEREFAAFAVSQVPERIELNADLDGTWHVLVTRLSVDALRADNYTLAATVTPVPLLPQNDALGPGDAPAACTPGGAGMPTVDTGLWSGVLRDDDFVDHYRFHADISELITLVLKPGETADGVNMALSLHDRDCALLAYQDAFGAPGSGQKGGPEIITRLPALYTGDYYVGIHRINGVGNHHLQLNVLDPMPSLPTNDGGTGADAPDNWQSGSVQALPAFQGTLPEGDTGDAYRIPVEAGRRIIVTFEGSALSQYDVRLFTPADVQVTQSNNIANGQVVVYSFTPTATGHYGIEVRPLLAGGDYVVSWAQSPVAG